MSDSDRRATSAARSAGKSVYEEAVDVVLTGIVVIIPVVITIYILNAAFELIVTALDPVIRLLDWAGATSWAYEVGFIDFLVEVGLYTNVIDFLTELIALTLLATVIVSIGLLARHRYGERVIDLFDYLIGSLPAIGTIYQSFRRMGDVLLESGVENFREVKLVEFPREGIYVIGFVTNQAPMPVEQSAEIEGMTTLFLPLAPNPVMGGFLTYIPDDRIRDIDMAVEDAVRTIVTSGIATDEDHGDDYRPLSRDELDRLRDIGPLSREETNDDD
ncbi:DUF502 domain-containing protein [Halorarius halobius]|uniref:DUF502 domain-containing protein n=1 Tax=Halorarius halobius TaxID=2962671 RepID=UPI0020CC088F|nr:DUF502 domain-containing protein [Halorarius halobius]